MIALVKQITINIQELIMARLRMNDACCKKIIKLQAQNMIKKREIRIKRENDKVILSLCIRDCLHFDYLRSSHSGLARYMLGFI